MNWINSTNAKETITLYLLRLKNKIFINSNLSLFEVNYLFEIFAPILTPFIPFIITFIHMFALFKDSQNLGLGRALGLGIGISISFYFKLFFVFFLIFVNVYLVLSHNKEEPYTDINTYKLQVLHSGFSSGSKNTQKFLVAAGYVIGLLSGVIAMKNEYKEIRIKKLDNLILGQINQIHEGTEKLIEIKKRITEEWKTLSALQDETAKHSAHLLNVAKLNEELTEAILEFQATASSDEATASELINICEKLKGNIGKYATEVGSLEDLIARLTKNSYVNPDNLDNTTNSNNSDNSSNSDRYRIEGLDKEENHKSSLINFEFDSSIAWFEGLRGMQKVAFCIILGKGILISAITSIVFMFYGDILIKKYELDTKFPKLAKVIELRKRYQKYSVIFNCLLILLVIITEVLAGLSILAIPLF